MSQNLPDLPDILREVRAFIEAVTPRVEEKDRYHAMCCSYLLAVAERELTRGEAAEREMQQARAALAEVSGMPLASDGELAARLREGRLDAHWDAALESVLRQVVARVRVSKPTHLDPLHQERVS
ncbi:MAG: hypothetical protein FJ164_11060 [Gammaproteobacteria bacterium]|nr:hypothetical protein [Gammaproteobacteria bacterium]